MVKVSKFVVLLSGVIGLVAFFLPILAVESSGIEGKLSAYQIVSGIETVKDVVKQAPNTGTAEEKQAIDQANAELDKYRGFVYAIFGPAALLALFGLIGVLRGRFGRGLAVPTLLFGLLGLAIWYLLDSAANEVGAEHGESVKGVAMHLLLVTGLGGTMAGLISTVVPDRG